MPQETPGNTDLPRERAPRSANPPTAGATSTQAGTAVATRSVLFAVRSAVALNRLLDVLPVFEGDSRVRRCFTLVPGSDFDLGTLAVLDRLEARTVRWDEAVEGAYDLVVAASPKGELDALPGPLALLPHGAGFGKTVPGEGTDGVASGLDAAFLVRAGRPRAAFHALAHPAQVALVADQSPAAAARARVVGDPTLDRLLASLGHRDRYRAALGTAGRRLVALTSTWGPESLLARRPDLPARLAARLPQDEYQLALLAHPNEHSRLGGFELAQRLAPATAAGLVLAGPYEDWAAVLVAADLVICDHGSTALYAAALDRPCLSAHDGGGELLPGSPTGRLLAAIPELRGPESVLAALRAHRPGAARALAAPAFAEAERGQSLSLLREELYKQLGIDPPDTPVTARPLPVPAVPPGPTQAAFAVRVGPVADSGDDGGEGRDHGRGEVRIERYPAHTPLPAHFLAAEHGVAGEGQAQGAGLLYRRAQPVPPTARSVTWTAGGWTERLLTEYPGCATAAAILSATRMLVRRRGGPLLSVTARAARTGTRLEQADPGAVLSAVHAWLTAHGTTGGERDQETGEFCALIGELSFPVRVSVAADEEAELPLP